MKINLQISRYESPAYTHYSVSVTDTNRADVREVVELLRGMIVSGDGAYFDRVKAEIVPVMDPDGSESFKGYYRTSTRRVEDA